MNRKTIYLLALSTAAVTVLPQSTSYESTSTGFSRTLKQEQRHLLKNHNRVVIEEDEAPLQARGEKRRISDVTTLAYLHLKKDYSEVPVGEGPHGTCGVARAPAPEWGALFDLIGLVEGPDGEYNVLFCGEKFYDYRRHPIETGEMPPEGILYGNIRATPFGRYQINHSTYESAVERGYFQNGVWPKEQDRVAVDLAERRGVNQSMLRQAARREDLGPVVERLLNRWTALNRMTTEELTNLYLQCWEVQRERHQRR